MTNTELCSKCGKTKDKHYFGWATKKYWCDEFHKDEYNSGCGKDCECDCHIFVGGSGKPCPSCQKDNSDNSQGNKTGEKRRGNTHKSANQNVKSLDTHPPSINPQTPLSDEEIKMDYNNMRYMVEIQEGI